MTRILIGLLTLATLGCDVVQGYHVSRPLPPERLCTWLAERSRTTAVPTV